ncbi:asparagine synthase (glutamine-hydrolyzing) [Pullulanibacillus sp. KACC 23026]|uniref:asparagine synthase (glutamine-hydrolyzing) n=1 Tax=Pullulanibacillus sp. KACC 23026 TaxID=3028315 RepID=UPI0023B1295E|nr:asparagine synthase (glutamine-hydrolyzing) [Pullulanibacillus sp. KACC 23026]WEG11956.1 asparagine synthase (glutamine-hydrolyzing) [Pullulanibacillus sp. KACC 23026]
MCGITGWIDWHRDLSHEHKRLEKMTANLHHRGPDEKQVWVSPRAAFGHARLIVVDPENGKQPMHKTVNERTFTLVYNGELYNTEDIRKELLVKGHSFKGHSDTEVLLTSYIEWGEACVDKFNGIFAFAIWDHANEKLFMARDRLGVKPLFYSEADGRFVFASELKSLFEHPDIDRIITREGLSEVFGLGPSRTPGHGVYKGISDLRPAHALTYSKDGLKVWRYWNVKSEEHTESAEETAEHVRFLFRDAVERQLFADVPVSTFLSGGLDSSVISAIAAHYYKEKGLGAIDTFSIDYRDNDKFFKKSKFQPNTDSDFTHKVADYIQSNHHDLIIGNDVLVDYLKEAVDLRDMPGYADVDSSLLWLCKGIKEHATVALSGECADELFGGYPWFHSPETSSKEGFPWMRSIEERQKLLNDHWQDKLNLKEYMLMRYDETVAETPRLEGETGVDAKRRELFYLNMHWFMTALLDRKDRMSMGASLEVRVPFADHRLVEYVWNIPWDIKMYKGREKGILRKAFEGWLPDEVLYRKKSPYPKTHDPGYTKAVSDWLKKEISKPSAPLLEIVDRKQVEAIIETNGDAFKVPWFGQLMMGPQLIAHLAQMNYWLETQSVKIEEA